MSKVGRYSRVSRRKWGDEKVCRLSFPKPNGFTLWDRLLTGPELSNVPGLFTARESGMAEAMGWDLKGFREAFAEVFREGLAEADWKAGFVLVPNSILHNEPESPNVILSWENTMAEFPDCALKDKAFAMLEAWAKAKGEAWAKAMAKALPKPSPKAMANQDQEQEQDQEQIPPTPQGGNKRKQKSAECLCPDELEADPATLAVADELQTDWRKHFAQMRDWSHGGNKRKANWQATLRNWMRSNPGIPKASTPNQPAKRSSVDASELGLIV